MPKVIPVPDALSQPFWDAVNEKRLVLQHCTACSKLQYPPQQTCQVCGSAGLEWKGVSGQATLPRISSLRTAQPAYARSALQSGVDHPG